MSFCRVTNPELSATQNRSASRRFFRGGARRSRAWERGAEGSPVCLHAATPERGTVMSAQDSGASPGAPYPKLHATGRAGADHERLLKEVILDFQETEPFTGVPRRTEVTTVSGKAAVCIGPRRSGKSTFLFQLVRKILDGGASRRHGRAGPASELDRDPGCRSRSGKPDCGRFRLDRNRRRVALSS